MIDSKRDFVIQVSEFKNGLFDQWVQKCSEIQGVSVQKVELSEEVLVNLFKEFFGTRLDDEAAVVLSKAQIRTYQNQGFLRDRELIP